MDKKMTDILRFVWGLSLLAALCCASGCGNYDVGPDPQPWSPSAEPAQKSSVATPT